MAFLKGKSPLFFVIGFALIIIAGFIYWRSEALEGIENVKLSQNLEKWAIGLFVAGLLSLIAMMVTGNKRVSK